jgi:hypothetical protein
VTVDDLNSAVTDAILKAEDALHKGELGGGLRGSMRASTERNDTLEPFWRRLRPFADDGGCCRCHHAFNPDGSPVCWQCSVCCRAVCQDCTLLIQKHDGTPQIPQEYYHDTFCSIFCWSKAGSPED